MNYTPASEIDFLHELYSQPPAIVAACNRVRMAQVREISGAVKYEAIKGLCGAAGVAVIALAIGWWAR